MSRKLKLLIAISSLIILAVLVGFIADTIYRQATSPQPFQSGLFKLHQQQVDLADFGLYFVTRTVFSTINITLLVVLILTYTSIYLKTRSHFTIGLLLFATVFLIKDLASSPLIHGVFGSGIFGLGPFALWYILLPDLFELIGLSVLVYLSIRY